MRGLVITIKLLETGEIVFEDRWGKEVPSMVDHIYSNNGYLLIRVVKRLSSNHEKEKTQRSCN